MKGKVRVVHVNPQIRGSLTPYSTRESNGSKVAYLPVELEHASTYGVNTPSNESLALAPLHAQQLLGNQVCFTILW